MSSGHVKVFETFVYVAIAKKSVSDQPKLEFMEIIWLEFGPESTTEYSKARVIRMDTEEKISGCIIGQ
jgi:hypothetical protein